MKHSAGILLFRNAGGLLEFLLVHPGGPYWAKKDEGWWTIPKGEIAPGEMPLNAALREFAEETGYKPSGTLIPLQPIVQKGGKKVFCWAAPGDFDPSQIASNTFTIEWPPKSGQMKTYPEVDKAGWFNFKEAKKLINERQVAFLQELNNLVAPTT